MKMTSAETSELVKLFDEVQGAKTFKTKSELLSKAKHFVFNRMSSDDLRRFFVTDGDKAAFRNLFALDVWTANLDEKNGIVDFIEPYDIVERVFGLFTSIEQLIDEFYLNSLYVFEQESDEKVKHLFVKRLIEIVNGDEIKFNSLENEEKLKNLLVVMAKQIPQVNCTYTKLLSQFLRKVSTPNLLTWLTPAFVAECDRIFELDTVQSFRVLELFVKIACTSESSFSQLIEPKFGLAKKIEKYLGDDSGDILSKLNCIELITCLVETDYGLAYLERLGYLKSLIKALVYPGASSDPFAALLVPSLVKLFAAIAKNKPAVISEKYPDYFHFLFNTASREDLVRNVESINLSIETFEYLLESNPVKKFLFETYAEEFSTLIQRLVSILRASINDKLRSNALTCLSEAFAVDPRLLGSQERTEEKWSQSEFINSPDWQNLSEKIYEKNVNHENVFNLCLSLAKQPFVEKRIAAHAYFKSLAQSKWGLLKLFEPNRYNGEEEFLNGYLLNRGVELEKQGLESKYELIRLLVANFEINSDLIKLVGSESFERMKLYIREGPFFTSAQSRVAFESN